MSTKQSLELHRAYNLPHQQQPCLAQLFLDALALKPGLIRLQIRRVVFQVKSKNKIPQTLYVLCTGKRLMQPQTCHACGVLGATNVSKSE
jgi:hypothetical protein